MAGERFVALGVAQVRSAWFKEVARWSTSAALPLEFVKCMTTDELLRARLGSGRPFSVLLADGSLPGVDRDLVETAREAGCAVVVVDDGRMRRDWRTLGVSAVLPADFSRADLAAVLEANAIRIGRGETNLLGGSTVPDEVFGAQRGRLVAVTGAGGTGTSVVAMALAQGLAARSPEEGPVALADLALDADQAMLHHSGEVIPGLQELVDAHRARWLEPSEIVTYTFALADRGYHLLLGLRRHRDWVTIRPRAFEAALDGLRRTFPLLVADIDPDVEGEEQCGSIDVEERNLLARTAARQADLVVVVAAPGLQGSHRLVRTVDGLATAGVTPGRILPVFNNFPRGPRLRAEHTRMVAQLVQARVTGAGEVAPPVFLPARRNLDDILRDAVRLPTSLTNPLATAVSALLARTAPAPAGDAASGLPFTGEPALIAPGSISAWAEEEAAR